MMSPTECISKAEACERMSFDCAADVDRQMLLAIAGDWRKLASVPSRLLPSATSRPDGQQGRESKGAVRPPDEAW